MDGGLLRRMSRAKMEAKMARWVTVRRVRRCIGETGCGVKRRKRAPALRHRLFLSLPSSSGGRPDEPAADANVFVAWPIICSIPNLGNVSAGDWRFRVHQRGSGRLATRNWLV